MDETAQQIVGRLEYHLGRGEYDKAIDILDLLLQKFPENPHFRYTLATVYSEVGKNGLALTILQDVVKQTPDHPQAWNNLGIVYKNTNQFEKAEEAYQKALKLDYTALTLANFSGLYINNGTPELAQKWAERGLKLDPTMPQLLNHRALAILEQQRWQEGFKAYDARFRLPGWHNRQYAGPIWNGEKVGTLLIHGEQGLGDEILFLTALDRVRQRADKIVMEAAVRLIPLLKANWPDIEILGTDQEIKASGLKWDAWIPMGSLFDRVGFERKGKFLTGTPYPKSGKMRVGVSWRGGTLQTHEHLRNFPVRDWLPLFDGIDRNLVELVSVQYGPAADMAKQLGLEHDQAAIDDFGRLVGLVESCDLVLTVCNTSVHIAGATGTPCWVLTPDKPAWRYCSHDDVMEFYQSVKLKRQAGRTWKQVISDLNAELKALCS